MLESTQSPLSFIISASLVDAVFLIIASYAGCNALIVGCMFSIAVASQGVQVCNMMINMIDLTPNFTATIAGLLGATSSLGGFAVPVIVGYLTPHVSGIKEKINNWSSSPHPLILLMLYLIR